MIGIEIMIHRWLSGRACLRDRTTMAATIAVDDFVFLVVRYRQPIRTETDDLKTS